jgi:hypothetical protein
MIIRYLGGPGQELLLASCAAPEHVIGGFAAIDILALTSSQLRETFGIRMTDGDAETPFQLAEFLQGRGAGRPVAALRKDRLARLIDLRPELLPCFVGYQEVSGVGILPFMTDAVPSRWSLFFESDGRMTLVERGKGGFTLTLDRDLAPSPFVASNSERRSFLMNGLETTRRALAAPAQKLLRQFRKDD